MEVVKLTLTKEEAAILRRALEEYVKTLGEFCAVIVRCGGEYDVEYHTASLLLREWDKKEV